MNDDLKYSDAQSTLIYFMNVNLEAFSLKNLNIAIEKLETTLAKLNDVSFDTSRLEWCLGSILNEAKTVKLEVYDIVHH